MASSRIVPNGDHAEYVFTVFQFDGMPDQLWLGQLDELPRELERQLERLKRAIEAG